VRSVTTAASEHVFVDTELMINLKLEAIKPRSNQQIITKAFWKMVDFLDK